MRVDGAHQRLNRGFGFHREDSLGDQLVRFRSDDVNAQDLAVFLLSHYLHEAIVVSQDSRLTVGDEWELAYLHRVALRPRLRFGEADTADAGLSISASRNAIAIDGLRWFARHVGHGYHAFHGRNMRQLRGSSHHI